MSTTTLEWCFFFLTSHRLSSTVFHHDTFLINITHQITLLLIITLLINITHQYFFINIDTHQNYFSILFHQHYSQHYSSTLLLIQHSTLLLLKPPFFFSLSHLIEQTFCSLVCDSNHLIRRSFISVVIRSFFFFFFFFSKLERESER